MGSSPGQSQSILQRMLAEYNELVGRRIAERYELVKLIGVGGAGGVFQARQHAGAIVRDVAIKLLPTRRKADVVRFEREAQLISQLHHPNTITLIDFGSTDFGYVFMVMELLRGHTLQQRLRKGKALPPARVADITLQTLGSLAEAHSLGIVHRDIKPANIYLAKTHKEGDLVKVLDFGIAKVHDPDGVPVDDTAAQEEAALKSAGQVIGTPSYMAPEQIGMQPLDGRADLYSLGVVMYRSLTGNRPYHAKSLGEIATLQRAFRVSLPEIGPTGDPIPREIEAIVARAMASRPDDRFANADSFREAIEECLPMLSPKGRIALGISGTFTGPMTGTMTGQNDDSLISTTGVSPSVSGTGNGSDSSEDSEDSAPPRPLRGSAQPRIATRWLWLLVAMLMLGVAVSVVLLIVLPKPEAAPAASPAPASPDSAHSGLAAAAAPATGIVDSSEAGVQSAANTTTVQVKFRTVPPGIEVIPADAAPAAAALGRTPFELSLGRSALPQSFRFRANGIVSPPIEVQAGADESVVTLFSDLSQSPLIQPPTAPPDAPQAGSLAPQSAETTVEVEATEATPGEGRRTLVWRRRNVAAEKGTASLPAPAPLPEPKRPSEPATPTTPVRTGVQTLPDETRSSVPLLDETAPGGRSTRPLAVPVLGDEDGAHVTPKDPKAAGQGQPKPVQPRVPVIEDETKRPTPKPVVPALDEE